MNKLTNYGSHNYFIPRLSFHLSAGKQISESKEGFTQAEKKLYQVLQKVSNRSIAGEYIKHGIQGGVISFRKLVGELQDQLRDAPGSLEKIIGRDGIEALKNIPSQGCS